MEKSWKLFSIFNDFLTKLGCDEIQILSGSDKTDACKRIFLSVEVGLRLSY